MFTTARYSSAASDVYKRQGPKQVASHYAAAAMAVSEANAAAVASGDALEGQEPLKEVESLAITSESLNQTYPMFASSLMNLIQNSESKITKEK